MSDAIENQDINLIESLLRYGVDPNESVSMYNTRPIMQAVDIGNVNVVRKLINNGSITDVADNFGTTPLIQSISSNKDNIALLLINNSKNINKVDGKGTSALQHAAKQGNEKIFTELLRQGANIRVVDNSGNNVLFYAIAGGNKRIIRNLINMGYFDLSYTNNFGETAYTITKRYGLHDIAYHIAKN